MKRIAMGLSGATPSYTATNFYTNNVYTEASDPGVAGTQEASIRIGILKHDVTNYSTGFLPVGPNTITLPPVMYSQP